MEYQTTFLKPDVPFHEMENCSKYNSTGLKLDESNLIFNINFDKAIVSMGDLSTKYTSNIWNLAQTNHQCIRLKVENGKLQARLRKLPANNNSNDDVILDDFPLEDIIIKTTKLEDLVFDPNLFVPIKTGKYIDVFWSRAGGILPATNILITGDPGIGKSSNLMDILVGILSMNPSQKVLYISAEMTQIDVHEFLQFYPGLEKIDFLFLGDYVTDPNQKIKAYQALQSTLDQGWNVVVIDSMYETQSMIQEDLDISSFRKGERYMLDLMNKHNKGHNRLNLYTSFLAIQQKNKSGQYVGSKRLEHMTTGFLQLLWDQKERGKRYMIFEKNRKGKEKIKLYYTLDKEKGIVYDSIRHSKELQIMEILQQNNGLSLEELETVDFEKLFEEKQADDSIILNEY